MIDLTAEIAAARARQADAERAAREQNEQQARALRDEIVRKMRERINRLIPPSYQAALGGVTIDPGSQDDEIQGYFTWAGYGCRLIPYSADLRMHVDGEPQPPHGFYLLPGPDGTAVPMLVDALAQLSALRDQQIARLQEHAACYAELCRACDAALDRARQEWTWAPGVEIQLWRWTWKKPDGTEDFGWSSTGTLPDSGSISVWTPRMGRRQVYIELASPVATGWRLNEQTKLPPELAEPVLITVPGVAFDVRGGPGCDIPIAVGADRYVRTWKEARLYWDEHAITTARAYGMPGSLVRGMVDWAAKHGQTTPVERAA
jgi:hypothetical protein